MNSINFTIFNDCSIRVYRSFVGTCHKWMNIVINVFYILPVILALCLMLSVTHYAQNYAGIIGGSLGMVEMTSISD